MSAVQHSIMIFLKKPVEIDKFKTQLENSSFKLNEQEYNFTFSQRDFRFDTWIKQYTNELEVSIPNEKEKLKFDLTFYPQNTRLIDAIDLTSTLKRNINLLENYFERIILTLDKNLQNCDTIVSFFPEFDEIVDFELYKTFKKGKIRQTKAYIQTKELINELPKQLQLL